MRWVVLMLCAIKMNKDRLSFTILCSWSRVLRPIYPCSSKSFFSYLSLVFWSSLRPFPQVYHIWSMTRPMYPALSKHLTKVHKNAVETCFRLDSTILTYFGLWQICQKCICPLDHKVLSLRICPFWPKGLLLGVVQIHIWCCLCVFNLSKAHVMCMCTKSLP